MKAHKMVSRDVDNASFLVASNCLTCSPFNFLLMAAATDPSAVPPLSLSSGNHPGPPKLLKGEVVCRTVVCGDLFEKFDRLGLTSTSHEVLGRLVGLKTKKRMIHRRVVRPPMV